MTRIYLNVGGVRYETTRSTLIKYPSSLLGRMFSAENSDEILSKDKDGSYFFDRNGALFERVLEVYRTGKFSYPDNAELAERLAKEYEYWKLIEPREQTAQAHVSTLRVKLSENFHYEDSQFDIIACGTTLQMLVASFKLFADLMFDDAICLHATPTGIHVVGPGGWGDTVSLFWGLPASSFASFGFVTNTEERVIKFSAGQFWSLLKPSVDNLSEHCALRLCDVIGGLVVQLFQDDGGSAEVHSLFSIGSFVPQLPFTAKDIEYFHDGQKRRVATDSFRNSVQRMYWDTQQTEQDARQKRLKFELKSDHLVISHSIGCGNRDNLFGLTGHVLIKLDQSPCAANPSCAVLSTVPSRKDQSFAVDHTNDSSVQSPATSGKKKQRTVKSASCHYLLRTFLNSNIPCAAETCLVFSSDHFLLSQHIGKDHNGYLKLLINYSDW